MDKTTRNWIIAGVVFVILILIAVFAMGKSTTPATPINPTANPNLNPNTAATTNILNTLGTWLKKKLSGSTSNSGYTQVPPIDANGCDANGYNAIGVKCL